MFNKTFYDRVVFVSENFLRYSNNTMANLMFDTRLRKSEYDILNSTLNIKNFQYFSAAATVHTFSFMQLAFFFRFRKISLPLTLGVAFGYQIYFQTVNNILYKLIVDRNVIKVARRLG